jgi:hypothetical protein
MSQPKAYTEQTWNGDPGRCHFCARSVSNFERFYWARDKSGVFVIMCPRDWYEHAATSTLDELNGQRYDKRFGRLDDLGWRWVKTAG